MRSEARIFIRAATVLTASSLFLGGCSTFDGGSGLLPTFNSNTQVTVDRSASKGDGSSSETLHVPEYQIGSISEAKLVQPGEGRKKASGAATDHTGQEIAETVSQSAKDEASVRQPANSAATVHVVPVKASRIGEPESDSALAQSDSSEMIERLRARSLVMLLDDQPTLAETARSPAKSSVTLSKLPEMDVPARSRPPVQATVPLSDRRIGPNLDAQTGDVSSSQLSGEGLESAVLPAAGNTSAGNDQESDPRTRITDPTETQIGQTDPTADFSQPTWEAGKTTPARKHQRTGAAEFPSHQPENTSGSVASDPAGSTVESTASQGSDIAASAEDDSTFPATGAVVPPPIASEESPIATGVAAPSRQSAALPPQPEQRNLHDLLLLNDRPIQSEVNLRIMFPANGTLLSRADKDRLKQIVQEVHDYQRRLEIRAYANATLRTKSEARRLAIKRLFAVREFLIQVGIPRDVTILRAFSDSMASVGANRVDIIAHPPDLPIDLWNPASILGGEGSQQSKSAGSGEQSTVSQAGSPVLKSEPQNGGDRPDPLAVVSRAQLSGSRGGGVQRGAAYARGEAPGSSPRPAPPIIDVVERPIQAIAPQSGGRTTSTGD